MRNKLEKHRNKFIVVAMLFIIIFGLLSPWKYLIEGNPVQLYVTIQVEKKDTIQLFYTAKSGEQFSEANSIREAVEATKDLHTVSFKLPSTSINRIRLDTGSISGKAWIKELKLKSFSKEYVWKAQNIKEDFEPSAFIQDIKLENNLLNYNITGNDPYLVSNDISKIYDDIRTDNSIIIYVYIGIALMVLCAVYVGYVFYKRALAFLKGIFRSRRLVFDLAKNDFKVKYAGSYLGIIWSFIQPMVTILLYWFVFQVGFHSGKRPDGTPYIFWMICGMVPWFYFLEALSNATNSLLEYSYLVKKVVFQVSVLPVVKIVSSFFVHLFFILFLMVICIINGLYPTVYTLQIFYYILCMFILLLGLSWVTSSIVVFLKDVSQIVNIVLQMFFWATPIVWSPEVVTNKNVEYLLKLNPMYYIVQGYRDSFLGNVWFWNHYNQTIYFWLVAGTIFFAGAVLFKRLRPHFSDVL